jgi:Domain of unknown function (DUF4293)
MIQRIQTLWLILAAACGFGMSQVALFEASLQNASVKRIFANESLLLFATLIATALLAVACIFLFRNRTLQFKLTVTGIFLSAGIIALEVYQIEQFRAANTLLKGVYQWGALLPIVMLIAFFLASRAIYKDERLVKSLDRLR